MEKTYKKVKVISLMDHEYREMYEGEMIVFKPRESKIMDRNAAAMFLGTYAGFDEKTGLPRVKAFTREPVLENVEPEATAAAAAPKKFVCQLDGREFESQEKLDLHLDTIRKRAGIVKKD